MPKKKPKQQDSFQKDETCSPIISTDQVDTVDANEELKEGFTASSSNAIKEGNAERIVDRLDLQLLVAIIVFFVSGWAFLNNRICSFTESEPNKVQMSYILVHYILSIFLFLCVYITFIKGNYVLKRVGDLSNDNITCIRLFIESWFPTLIICIFVLVTASFIPWYLWAFVTIGLLYWKTWDLHIHLPNRLSIVLAVIVGFPLFISTMTVVIKDITIITDKDYYSLSEDITVSVDTKGYACNHTMVCLGDEYLYPGSQYKHIKNSIIVPASYVRDNVIAAGTITPASGINNFFRYPLYKMLGKDYIPSDNKQSALSGGVYYKTRRTIIR